MALVKCKECKNMISRDATNCPHCGKPKPKKRTGCALLLGLCAVIAIISALTSSDDSVPPAANKAPKETKTKPTYPTPAIESSSINLADDPMVEPKWSERMEYWKEQFRGSFSQPTIGENIDIVLTTGVAYQGQLLELSDQSVTIQVEQGTLAFDKTNIRPDSRTNLFSEDFLTLTAGKKVKAERDAFRARIAAQQHKKQQEKIKKLFSAWDGSLYSLVSQTKKSMNDAKSFEHVETRYSDNGTNLTVWMKFRGKNMLGAMVLNTITAKVDYEGNVIAILATEP